MRDTNQALKTKELREEDSLRPVHHHRLPHRFVHSDPWRGLQRGEQVHGHHRQRLPGELHRTGEPLLGWRHSPAVYLRAGRHAVHHRVHRGAAAARGHPRFEALHKEGQSGEAKLTQYTRYLTIGLAVLQSTTILVTARSGALFNYQCDQVIPDGSVFNLVVMVLIMTGGTSLIMWMAELVTDKGIGQGMSILIFMSICSGFLPQLWEIGYGTDGTDGDWLKFGIVVGVLVWSSSSSSTSSNCASAACRSSTRAA